MIPFLDWINLLEQLTELGKWVYLWIKSQMKRYMYKVLNKGASLSPWSLGPSTVVCENIMVHQCKALQIPSFWVFMEASLHRHEWLNHWPLVTDQPLALLSSLEMEHGTESSNPLITWLVLLAYCLQSEVQPESHHSITKDTSVILFTWEIPRVLGALC